ncbi:MAG: HigA protein (antitoxin to HigB) [uncultured Thermomicrobiales bacterium]|uniref:HigA protein (Antitoxin to HigB) n=1 Tax=uncultured Thermomicrobiales bacterium TaxID=1645740 RepID=A0A6J4VTP0_9BACT|nr:MAG: HigA protein (antitoxin to HigB) [uncultured Thermomicrobiales bacterium]
MGWRDFWPNLHRDRRLSREPGVSATPRRAVHAGDARTRADSSGEILAEDVLVELGMSRRQLADALGVSPNRISEILRGPRAISADTAVRLERWLGTSATIWLNLQQAYDLEVAAIESGVAIARKVTPRSPAA